MLYCCLVWALSSDLTDVLLNSTMCTMMGTLHSPPLAWLPVLSNIEPPVLRRKAALDNLIEKTNLHAECPQTYAHVAPCAVQRVSVSRVVCLCICLV